MGGDDNGSALLIDLLQELDYTLSRFWIEVAGGLVGKKELGLGGECAGNHDSLQLSSRELDGKIIFLVRKTGEVKELLSSFENNLVIESEDVECEIDVLGHGTIHQDLKILEDHPDLATKEGDVFGANFFEIV